MESRQNNIIMPSSVGIVRINFVRYVLFGMHSEMRTSSLPFPVMSLQEGSRYSGRQCVEVSMQLYTCTLVIGYCMEVGLRKEVNMYMY